jgi:hypothetical protein
LEIGSHLEFLVGGLLELGEQESWGCEDEEQKQMTRNNENPHESSFACRQ